MLVAAPGFRNSEIYEAASQNYMGKIQALQEKYAHLIVPRTVIEGIVAHDDHCASQNGGPG